MTRGDELGGGGAVVVGHYVGGVDAERVEQPDDRGGLGGQRPVGAGRGLGVAEAEQVRGDAPEVGAQQRDDLPPDVGGERAAVQQQQRGPGAVVEVGDPRVAYLDVLLHRLVSSIRHSPRSSRLFTHGSAMR